MKANELRIGNWVNGLDNHPMQATGNLISFYAFEENDGSSIMETPIDITPEWLEKLGFEFFQGWWYLDAFSPGHPSQRFDLYWSKDDGFMTKSRYQPDITDQFFMRHIKYIHQVQNLYFALTGQELQLRPPNESSHRADDSNNL